MGRDGSDQRTHAWPTHHRAESNRLTPHPQRAAQHSTARHRHRRRTQALPLLSTRMGMKSWPATISWDCEEGFDGGSGHTNTKAACWQQAENTRECKSAHKDKTRNCKARARCSGKSCHSVGLGIKGRRHDLTVPDKRTEAARTTDTGEPLIAALRCEQQQQQRVGWVGLARACTAHARRWRRGSS